MKPSAMVKESRPEPLKLPMPSENDDSDDGRKSLGNVVPSTSRTAGRSSGGREGVCDPSAVDDEAQDD